MFPMFSGVPGASIPEKERLIFLSRAQSHYAAAGIELLNKSPLLRKALLRRFRCLQPKNRISGSSRADIQEIARHLPVDVPSDILADEWAMLQVEKETVLEADSAGNRTPIDCYWRQYFCLKTDTGVPKYPNVAKVVKAALSLSHGNADVERGFSSSALSLTDVRASMGERTLNSIMTCKNALNLYGNKPENVPITKKMISLAQSAHLKYREHLEAEKKKKEDEVKKAREEEHRLKSEEESRKKIESERESLQKDEEMFKRLKEEATSKRKLADKAMSSAMKRMKEATDSKNMESIGVAQIMLQGADIAKTEADRKMKDVEDFQNQILKKKNKLIVSLENKLR